FLVFQIFDVADVGDPLGMASVPIDGFAQSFLERDSWPPTQFLLDLGRIHGIAAVVARPIANKANQGAGLCHNLQQGIGQIEIGAFAAAADVVDFADPTFAPHAVNSGTVVVDVNPIAD